MPRGGQFSRAVDTPLAPLDVALTGSKPGTPPGLFETIATCRAGDVVLVTTLGRLTLSRPDARDRDPFHKSR